MLRAQDLRRRLRNWAYEPCDPNQRSAAKHARWERGFTATATTSVSSRAVPRARFGVIMEFEGQRVLVTGATAGIGRETASLFARHGTDVVISGRNVERSGKTVETIEAEGGHARFIAADMGDMGSVRQLAEQAGPVDVLVNNAAVFPFAPTLTQDLESFEVMFDVNVRGPFF